MSADEDFIDSKKHHLIQQNTFVKKIMHINFTDYEFVSSLKELIIIIRIVRMHRTMCVCTILIIVINFFKDNRI